MASVTQISKASYILWQCKKSAYAQTKQFNVKGTN